MRGETGMKRLAVLICLVLCLATLMGAAQAGFVLEKEYIGDMEVVNCKEWVSLRKRPSTSATRLESVPLGAIVTDCRNMTGDFIECTYNGKTGYILKKYLTKIETRVDDEGGAAAIQTQDAGEFGIVAITPEGSAIPTAIPVSAGTPKPAADKATPAPTAVPATPEPTANPLGEVVQEALMDEGTVKVYRKMDKKNEAVTIVCTAASGETAWEYETSAANKTEKPLISVLMGNSDLSAFIMIYNPDEGLTLLFYGSPLWTVAASDLELKGDIVYAISADSTIYVGASEGSDPAAISLMGELLWKADSEGCSGLKEIYADEFGLICSYDVIDGKPVSEGYVFYDANGQLLEKDGVSSDTGAAAGLSN